MTQTTETSAVKTYEDKQAEIRKLLKQIEAGLQKHDRSASGQGGINWGHVGDLTSIASTLTELKDRLHLSGEYSEAAII